MQKLSLLIRVFLIFVLATASPAWADRYGHALDLVGNFNKHADNFSDVSKAVHGADDFSSGGQSLNKNPQGDVFNATNQADDIARQNEASRQAAEQAAATRAADEAAAARAAQQKQIDDAAATRAAEARRAEAGNAEQKRLTEEFQAAQQREADLVYKQKIEDDANFLKKQQENDALAEAKRLDDQKRVEQNQIAKQEAEKTRLAEEARLKDEWQKAQNKQQADYQQKINDDAKFLEAKKLDEQRVLQSQNDRIYPQSSVEGVKLQKSLASEAQNSGNGTVFAGPNARKPYDGAQKKATQYGGQSDDWVKKSSPSFTAKDGTKFETHWIENTKTGIRREHKTIFSE